MNDKFDPYEVMHDEEARGMAYGVSTAWCREGFTLAAAKQSLFESHDLDARVVFIRHEDPTGSYRTNLPVLIDTMRAITSVPDLVDGCTAAWYFEGEFLAPGYTKTRRIRIFAEFTGPEDAVGEHDRFTYQLFVAPTPSKTAAVVAAELSLEVGVAKYHLARGFDPACGGFGLHAETMEETWFTLSEAWTSLLSCGSPDRQTIDLLAYDPDEKDGPNWKVPASIDLMRRVSLEEEGVTDWYMEGETLGSSHSRRRVRICAEGLTETHPAGYVDWQYTS